MCVLVLVVYELVSSRGLIEKLGLVFAGASEEWMKAVRPSSLPLPDEPVGAGAEWQIMTGTSDGSTRTATYELVSIDGDRSLRAGSGSTTSRVPVLRIRLRASESERKQALAAYVEVDRVCERGDRAGAKRLVNQLVDTSRAFRNVFNAVVSDRAKLTDYCRSLPWGEIKARLSH